MDDVFYPKKPQKYFCKICDFKSCNKKDYDRHLTTDKHQKMTLSSKPNDDGLQDHKYKCGCGKEYMYRQGLWKHSKKCNGFFYPKKPQMNNETIPDIQALTNLIFKVVKHNNDLANKMVDLCKTQPTNFNTVISNNVISNNNTNNNTNTFNLNVFLNEKCKDAMNITDFVDSIKLDLSDLETVGKLGYVEGISNIILKNLKALDITERPIHCADKKREVIYIKDEDKWEKEDGDKKRLKKVIKKVAYKNEKLLPQYKKKYPDYNDSESKRSDQFSKIIIEAMGGAGDNDEEKEQKILKKIAKEVVIDKTISCMD